MCNLERKKSTKIRNLAIVSFSIKLFFVNASKSMRSSLHDTGLC